MAVCFMAHSDGKEPARDLANARLIAAAPDMLSALVEADNALSDYIDQLEKRGGSMNYGHAVLRRVRAALAAASDPKGETK